MLDLRLSIDF